MTKETVLLTGATGFLGSYLLKSLVENGYSVIVLLRSSSNTWRIRDYIDKVKVYKTDDESIVNAFQEQQVDLVVHTACSYGRNSESLASIVETNVVFSLKILEAAIANRVDTFINTDTLLQRNLNTYSLSKKQFTDWLNMFSSKIQILNMNVEHMYGPMDGENKFVSWLISRFQAGDESVDLTSGIQKRDFIFIDDVVSAFLLVLERRKQLSVFSNFDVGTGSLVAVRDFVEELYRQYCSAHPDCRTHLNFGARQYRPGEMMEVKINTESLKSLGWEPQIIVREGIKRMLIEAGKT